jgi:hypothetical protein
MSTHLSRSRGQLTGDKITGGTGFWRGRVVRDVAVRSDSAKRSKFDLILFDFNALNGVDCLERLEFLGFTSHEAKAEHVVPDSSHDPLKRARKTESSPFALRQTVLLR